MNEKEIAEIRRRFRPDKGGVTRVRGCYVNDQREIVSEFQQSLPLMPQEESGELLAILRKVLSGTVGKNLLGIEFSTRQVMEGDEHKLLMALRESGLENDDAVREFYGRAIRALDLEGNYLILLACDKYDVPGYAKDGEKLEDASEVFSYFLCGVCPIKLTKPALGYYAGENTFRNTKSDWLVSPPELGFMFPAFDDRSANIYNALYYTRDIAENHPGFVDAVFHTPTPMPAAAQKEAFQSILGDTVGEDCSLEVVQTIHGQLAEMIADHKANKEEEPPVVSKKAVQGMLESCGVAQERVTAFTEKYDAEFGADTAISPHNLVDTRHLEVRTPDVTIQVNPERGDLIETRVIDGARYILIRADEGVEVNGVNITIAPRP